MATLTIILISVGFIVGCIVGHRVTRWSYRRKIKHLMKKNGITNY